MWLNYFLRLRQLVGLATKSHPAYFCLVNGIEISGQGYVYPSKTLLSEYYIICVHVITPGKIRNIKFVKPTSKLIKPSKALTKEDVVSSGRNAESTQDASKTPADKLYSVIHKLVPQACLLTIVPIPEHDEGEPGFSQSLLPDPSVNNLLPT